MSNIQFETQLLQLFEDVWRVCCQQGAAGVPNWRPEAHHPREEPRCDCQCQNLEGALWLPPGNQIGRICKLPFPDNSSGLVERYVQRAKAKGRVHGCVLNLVAGLAKIQMVAADSGYHKITYYNSPLPMIILSSGNNLIVKLSLKTADLLNW